MSQETLQWLEDNTRIGDTDQMGTAWHWRKGATNHFPGAVPVEVVEELILPFEPQRQPLYIKHTDGTFHEVPDYIGVASENDPYKLHAIHSDGYRIHNYKKTLLDNVKAIVGKEDLHISSAGVLKGGAVVWVELSITPTMTVEGFAFRPYLLATTSSNGRYATGYGRKVQFVVCDNTHAIAENEKGQKYEIRHTAGSEFRLKDAATAVGIIFDSATRFEDEFHALDQWKVPPRLFSRYLDLMIPEKAKDGGLLSPAAQSRVEKKRYDMAGMWRGDPRVAPWAGSAFGVLQLNSTWTQHETGVGKASAHRVEKNMLAEIGGDNGASDMHALGILRGLSDAYGYHVPEQFEGIQVPDLSKL